MFERPQSLFLAVITVSMILLNFYPIWIQEIKTSQAELNSLTFTLTTNGTEDISQTFYIAILSVLSAGIAAFALANASDRKKQIKICQINSLVLMVITLACLYPLFALDSEFTSGSLQNEAHTGIYFLLAGLVSNMIATRLIRKDERKVRDANRLR